MIIKCTIFFIVSLSCILGLWRLASGAPMTNDDLTQAMILSSLFTILIAIGATKNDRPD